LIAAVDLLHGVRKADSTLPSSPTESQDVRRN